MVLLGLPMWLFALVGGSLAFAIADILCDIVISEGDSHEVGSAEDSDAEEGTEMTATPRRDASKASKPGYAPVANQSTPALPPRGEPAWSEPSPVKATYLADGQSADASLSGTQDAAISGLVTATWLLGSVLYKLVLAPGALAHASAVEMRWRPDTHIEFWFAMLGGLCAFLHNFYLLKAFEGAPSTVLLPLIQVASIWVLLGSSVIALFRGQRFMSPLHGLAYAPDRPHRCRPHRCRPHRCRPHRCRPHRCRHPIPAAPPLPLPHCPTATAPQPPPPPSPPPPSPRYP
jgi:hypothetical protein